MPVVVQENNGYTIQRITSAGDTEDLYRSDQRSYRLSDITTPRTTRW